MRSASPSPSRPSLATISAISSTPSARLSVALTSSPSWVASDPPKTTSAWFRGLGRPQGLALDRDSNVYVAASLRGQRGLVRITPDGNAELVVAGYNLVGVAFSPLGTTILATHDAVYDVDLGVEGLNLF